jgi:hypothetical protein
MMVYYFMVTLSHSMGHPEHGKLYGGLK